MATEAHKFQVGVFVIAAVAIGLGVAIWLGASRFFEETRRFTTYFSESVQGLDPGAAVKYRGVPAGRVERIEIAPDRNLVEVVMAVDTDVAKVLQGDETLRAQLELSGITGLRYIEIDRRGGEALRQAPELSFKPPYPVIPSARSSFKAIQSALGDIYDRIMKVDLGGMSEDARTALQSVTHLVQDPRIDDMLTNFDHAAQSAQHAARGLETIAGQVNLSPAIDNATKATADARTLFAGLKTNVSGQELGQTIDQLNRLANSAQQFIFSLQGTMDRLERAAGNLQGLTEEVRQQPSLLIFGEPPPSRRSADHGSR